MALYAAVCVAVAAAVWRVYPETMGRELECATGVFEPDDSSMGHTGGDRAEGTGAGGVYVRLHSGEDGDDADDG